MNVLLLGVGAQGKAALHDLARSDAVESIVAVDLECETLTALVKRRGYGAKVHCRRADVSVPQQLDALFKLRPSVVIDLLPVIHHQAVIDAAVRHAVHLVNTSYIPHAENNLDLRARNNDISILPEFGMDPGIDLVLMAEAVRSFDEVESLISYGAGFPEPETASNPLKYKVTWTFEGVLRSYRRRSRIVSEGKILEIPQNEIFAPGNYFQLVLDGLGTLEAYPNGDALRYAFLLGIEPTKMKRLGRYVLRWPGHCAFWKKLIDLHLLDEAPVEVEGVAVDRINYLARVISPHIQYKKNERDIVVVRVEAVGRKDGARAHTTLQLIDRRDLATGLSAMSRTVGFTASIGAQMIGNGSIEKHGLLSPARDVPYELFRRELHKRGLEITVENYNLH